MPPQAIADDVHLENTIEMIDRLMAMGKLTRGQESYLKTRVQLVQVYESSHHIIQKAGAMETLRQLLDEHGMSASDLARLLDIHVSMGSKIVKGDRAPTVDHIKVLAAKIGVRPDTFID